jgi:gamma-glutamyl-gamma-aminobutyrate hydrolase PuuD
MKRMHKEEKLEAINRETLEVNSLHHQSIKGLGQGMLI